MLFVVDDGPRMSRVCDSAIGLNNNDLLVNDNFSVVSSGELLLWDNVVAIAAVVGCFVVVDFDVASSERMLTVDFVGSSAIPAKTIVELVNEEFLESVMGKDKVKKKS